MSLRSRSHRESSTGGSCWKVCETISSLSSRGSGLNDATCDAEYRSNRLAVRLLTFYLPAEDNMNIQLKDITVTARDGRVSHLDQVYIRGSHVRFFIVPDMLRYVWPVRYHSLHFPSLSRQEIAANISFL